jgi:phosphoserine phosphatase
MNAALPMQVRCSPAATGVGYAGSVLVPPRGAQAAPNRALSGPAPTRETGVCMSDLRQENENLRRILDVTRYMAITNDLDVLLGTIVEATCDVLDCERATIFLYDPQTRELYSRVAKGVDAIRFPADRGIAGAAAQGRACVNVPEAYADARFNPEVDRRTGFKTRNLLTFPLENLNSELIGVLQALNKRGRPFGADDEGLARVLSAQAGVALERGKLIEEYAEKQRMQRDLELARSIQTNGLPRSNPRVAGYEVAGWNRSADETGGDTYDFIPLPDGRLAMVLADATGHGVPAALVILQCRSLLRAMLSVTDDLPTIAARVNDLLAADLTEDRFVTAFVGILDPVKHEVEYISGGQGPLLLVSGEQAEARPANAVPFAVVPGLEYGETGVFRFEPGATLVLLTDGFYEAADPRDEQFGEQRVVDLVRKHAQRPLTEMIETVYAEILQFVAGAKQADDLTAVLVRRVGAGAAVTNP